MQQQSRQASARSGINNNEVFPSNSESAVCGGSTTGSAGHGGQQQQHLKTSEAVTIYPSRPPPQVQGHLHQQGGHQGQAKRQQRLQRQKEIDTFYRRSTSESLPEDTTTEVVTSSFQPPNHHDPKIRHAVQNCYKVHPQFFFINFDIIKDSPCTV